MKKVVMGALMIGCIIALIAGSLLLPGRRIHTGSGRESNTVAIVYVEGQITGGRGKDGLFRERAAGDATVKQLRRVREDSGVKAVVIRINSPGGSAAASYEIGEEIAKLRQSGKIVVASMGDVAASGGYWIAAKANKIVANPSTLTGSIGVFFPLANWEELYKKIGIQPDIIKSGPHKDMGSPARALTAEERRILQGIVDDIYDQFVTVVAEGRHMDREKVKQLADGRIYTGRQAQALGLVDELGNMYDAIQLAAQLADIKGKPVIKEYDRVSPLELILGYPDGADSGILWWLGHDLSLLRPEEFPFSR